MSIAFLKLLLFLCNNNNLNPKNSGMLIETKLEKICKKKRRRNK